MSFPTGSNHDMGRRDEHSEAITLAGLYGMQTAPTLSTYARNLYAGTIKPWSWVFVSRRLPLRSTRGTMGQLSGAERLDRLTLLPGLTTTVRLNYNIQSQIVGAGCLRPAAAERQSENWGGKMIRSSRRRYRRQALRLPGSRRAGRRRSVYQNLNARSFRESGRRHALRWKVGEESGRESLRPASSRTGAALVRLESYALDGVHVG